MNRFPSLLGPVSELRPEDGLLILCARTVLDGETETLIRALARGPIDWDGLVNNAEAHGVMPLLYRSLQSACARDVPETALKKLQLRFLSNAAHNQILTRRLLDLLARLDSNAIPVVPIKGPVLAACAYGSISLRQFDDLDILVHRRDAIQTKSHLEAVGYTDSFGLDPKFDMLQMRYRQHFNLVSHSPKTLVEVHWTLESSKKWLHFSDVTLWERLETATLEGESVRHLSSEDLLLYLCVHGSNHCWQRLSWICDVAELLRACPDLDWNAAIEQAGMLRRHRMLFLGLFLATDLLDAPIQDDIRTLAVSYPGVEKLAGLVRTGIVTDAPDKSDCPETQCGTMGGGVVSTFSFRLKARESPSDKVFFCSERFLFPDPLDFQFLDFPPYLLFFYFVVRPLRLLGKWWRDVLSKPSGGR